MPVANIIQTPQPGRSCSNTRRWTYLGQNGHLDRRQELDVTDDAVPTVPFAFTAAPLADGEFVQKERVAPLEDLDVADTGVRYVRVHAGCPVP